MEVQGSLTLTGEHGEDVGLHAEGAVIALDAGNAGALLRLAAVGGGRAGRGERVARLQGVLSATGLCLELRLSGVRIGLLAGETRAGLLARALGVGPIRFEILALVRALLKGSRNRPQS